VAGDIGRASCSSVGAHHGRVRRSPRGHALAKGGADVIWIEMKSMNIMRGRKALEGEWREIIIADV